jgi:DNA-binding LacI/PurR family transcriptional regulator
MYICITIHLLSMLTTQYIPIYKQLIAKYREEIISQKYPPGSRIESITELRSKHKISRETAKLVLKSLAEENLIIQKAGKGSFITDAEPKNGIWGIVVPFLSIQTEELLDEIRQQASIQGKKIEYFIDNNDWREEIRLVGSLIKSGYEVVLVIPTFDESKTAAFYRGLVTSGTLVTLLDHTMAGSWFPYVIQSYDLGVTRAVEYLLSRTRGNLAFVRNETWAGRNMVQELMEKTFMSKVEVHDGSRKAHLTEHISRIDNTFLKKEKIGGIFCFDDLVAVRLLGRLKGMNINIPEDVSLVSYGNTELCRYTSPMITSVDCHSKKMAKKTAEIIYDFRNQKDTSFSQFILQPELIIRET